MWTREQRQRYDLLLELELGGTLTVDQKAELAALVQDLKDFEAQYLAAANQRKEQEAGVLKATIDRLEAQNRELQQCLHERQAFRERVRTLVTNIRAEDRKMRERFADLLTLIGDSTTAGPR